MSTIPAFGRQEDYEIEVSVDYLARLSKITEACTCVCTQMHILTHMMEMWVTSVTPVIRNMRQEE